MSACVECPEGGNDALPDDYLCQDHRDVVEGARYCKECKKRFVPDYGNKDILCPTCVVKQKCEYCDKMYSQKRQLAQNKNGVRFKGLCNDCREMASASVPKEEHASHMLVECPDCNYMWDVDLDLQSVY